MTKRNPYPMTICQHAEAIAKLVKKDYGLDDAGDLALDELELEAKRPANKPPRSDQMIAYAVAQRIEQP